MNAIGVILAIGVIPAGLVGMMWGWGVEAENWGWIAFSYAYIGITSLISAK